MIYEYEARVLEHIRKAVPEIELATYAKEQDMLSSMSQVTKYPSFFYHRSEDPWSFPPTWQVNKDGTYISFAPLPETYTGKIVLANVFDTMHVARVLRFFWIKNAYVQVPVKFGSDVDSVEVGLRLLYIKIGEERSIVDKKGPLRYVEFSWSSQLFIDDNDLDPIVYGLVEEVHLYHTDNGVGLFNANNLIKIIK